MQPLRPDELDRVVRCEAGRGPTRARNHALVSLLAGSGLGMAEVLAITPDDVETASASIRVAGRRARVIPVSHDAVRSVAAWCAQRDRMSTDGDAPLFCTTAGAPLEASYVRRLLVRLGRAAQVEGGLNARRLRETYAAQRLSDGLTPQALGEELGHTSPVSTRRYVRALAPEQPAATGWASSSIAGDPLLIDALLENAHCGLVVLRAVRDLGAITDFTIEYANPSGAGSMGTSPEELIGSSVAERFPDATANGTIGRWAALIEARGRTADTRLAAQTGGRARPFSVRRVAHGDRLILSFSDLGALKEAEGLKAQIQARSDAIAGALHDGVVTIDRDGRIATANPSAERILGVPAGRLIGRTAFDPRWQAVNEDGSPCRGPAHPSVITQRTGQAIEGRVIGTRRGDGTTAWMRISTQPIEGEGGPPFPVVVAFSDLGETHRAESRARRAEAAVAMLAGSSGGLVLRCAPDGTILEALGDTEGLLGVSSAALVGRRCEEGVAPQDRDRVSRAYATAMESRLAIEIDHDAIHSSGALVRVARTLRAVWDPMDGDVEEVQSFLRPSL